MIPVWLYNIIKCYREREGQPMQLDFVLDKVGNGSNFTLVENHPSAVSVQDMPDFYIKPSVMDTTIQANSKIILFSAPGATGKSALARYISYTKHALLWDLSMERIANHSFSGMLVESLGNKEFSRFTEGLANGSAVLVIDALDEAELISGRPAVETLLQDLRLAVLNATSPNIILCARTETAHYIKHYYSQEATKLEISQYEISFFEDTNAEDFIKGKIGQNHTVTPATAACVKAQFAEIKRLLDGDDEAIKSFIGYAPVLEALSVFYDEESNTMQLLQKTQKADCSAEIFQKIMEHILKREQRKVVNGIKERCQEEYPDFDSWDSVYSPSEQLLRLINYVIFEDIDLDIYDNAELPKEIKREYHEGIKSFLKDHPFIHIFEAANGPKVDFTGPAFRDFVLARLMTDEKMNTDCDDYAQCYFSDHSHNVRFPSQLYFDLYEYFSDGKISLEHFKYLYDAFKAKESAKAYSSVSVEQVEDEVFFIFKQDGALKSKKILESEFKAESGKGILPIIQISNGYIDVDIDVQLGSATEDVTISNSTIKCRKIILQAPNVTIIADGSEATLIACRADIDASLCPNAKFEIRADSTDLLKVSATNIGDWFKFHKYQYDLEDENDLDLTKFENAVRSILKHFRKHKKDAAGRHKEYIENIIVGGSQLKRNILDFFILKGIIYEDAKDLKQYKLNNAALEELDVNWSMLSQNSTQEMKKLYTTYTAWDHS